MPRMVALTMLSLLTLLIAAMLYTIVAAIGFEVLGWSNSGWAWIFAGIVAFVGVIGMWLALWGTKVTWTTERIVGTVGAAVGAVILSAVVGGVCGFLTGQEEFGLFIGSSLPPLIWVGVVCLIWVDRTPRLVASSNAMTGVDDGDVKCSDCGYSMRGLTTTRCPECGRQYTLDELLLAQQKPDLA